jgi:hypothetical protein
MTTVTVGHHPELTAEQAMEVFSRQLADKYDVYRATGIGRWLNGGMHFVVRKSNWAAVGVRLWQKKNSTKISFVSIYPPIVLVGLFGALVGVLITMGIAWIMLKPSWKAIEADITSCIENAVEFK